MWLSCDWPFWESSMRTSSVLSTRISWEVCLSATLRASWHRGSHWSTAVWKLSGRGGNIYVWKHTAIDSLEQGSLWFPVTNLELKYVKDSITRMLRVKTCEWAKWAENLTICYLTFAIWQGSWCHTSTRIHVHVGVLWSYFAEWLNSQNSMLAKHCSDMVHMYSYGIIWSVLENLEYISLAIPTGSLLT